MWAEKVKVVCFVWSAYGISWGCWFLLQQLSEFPTLNPFLGKCGMKKSKLLFCLKINTQYLKDADSYFDVISFPKFQTYILRMLILIPGLVLWNPKTDSISLGEFESKKLFFFYFSWKLVHRVSWRCDCKDSEEGLEAKIKMNNCIKCLLFIYFYGS